MQLVALHPPEQVPGSDAGRKAKEVWAVVPTEEHMRERFGGQKLNWPRDADFHAPSTPSQRRDHKADHRGESVEGAHSFPGLDSLSRPCCSSVAMRLSAATLVICGLHVHFCNGVCSARGPWALYILEPTLQPALLLFDLALDYRILSKLAPLRACKVAPDPVSTTRASHESQLADTLTCAQGGTRRALCRGRNSAWWRTPPTLCIGCTSSAGRSARVTGTAGRASLRWGLPECAAFASN